jgi:peptide deformylase
MAAQRILQLGDPALRRVSGIVAAPADAIPVLRDLADTLSEFRRTHGFGRGISAIQIGEPVRVIFLEVDGVRYEIVNPVFLSKSPETFWLWDDCFSFPNLMVRLSRHRKVVLHYSIPSGDLQTLEAEGALSELIQHEMDHLDGVLAVDHAASGTELMTRDEWLRRGRPQPNES